MSNPKHSYLLADIVWFFRGLIIPQNTATYITSDHIEALMHAKEIIEVEEKKEESNAKS